MTVRFGRLVKNSNGNGTIVTNHALFRSQILPRIQLTISATSGGVHSAFLKSDGTVWATGENNNGELGDGSTNSKNRAVQVTELSGNYITVSAISAGSAYSVFKD